MVAEWSQPERVAEYLARSIPYRDVAEELLLAALPDTVERVVDLGTGDGRLLRLVASAHPAARGLGLDGSDPMLERARTRFAGDDRFELRAGDLARRLKIDGGADVVVSGLALHHLEDDRKRALFAEVFELLRPGGVFANLDLVTSASEAGHVRFRELIGLAEDDPSDRLADLGLQLDWLRRAGFVEVDAPFKWLELVLMIARRP